MYYKINREFLIPACQIQFQLKSNSVRFETPLRRGNVITIETVKEGEALVAMKALVGTNNESMGLNADGSKPSKEDEGGDS